MAGEDARRGTTRAAQSIKNLSTQARRCVSCVRCDTRMRASKWWVRCRHTDDVCRERLTVGVAGVRPPSAAERVAQPEEARRIGSVGACLQDTGGRWPGVVEERECGGVFCCLWYLLFGVCSVKNSRSAPYSPNQIEMCNTLLG